MRNRLTRSVLFGCLMSLLALAGARAQETTSDLSNLSLEGLTQVHISVSSFARKDEDLWKTPAAVFVITREDIARSAATSIPELLRIVPGMQVAQIDASTWAVSARGFNSAYADKLLVLVDGRSVYSELNSGVHWDEVDLPLEDVERIEVIRGPGAAVWGTNAVNGVVNIITRRAHSTLGGHVTGSIGRINESANLRYGGTLGDRAQYRGYFNYLNREPMETSTGSNAFDGEYMVRGGGRIDWQRTWADWITVTGDLYGGHFKQQALDEFALPIGPNGEDKGSLSGGHILGRWEHKMPGSDTALQVYYDDQSRFSLTTHGQTRALDFDFEDHIVAGSRNDLVWGSELRFSRVDVRGPVQTTTKPVYNDYLVNGFLQDEFSIIPNRLVATIGSKIQDGTLAGFQVQPSVRLLWAINDAQSVWVAASKAVVAPAIQEKAIMLPLSLGTEFGLPIFATLNGNPNYQPQYVYAYEAGYRTRLRHNVTLDVAAFFNDNRRIKSITAGPFVPVFTPTPHIEGSFVYSSGFRARSAGVETALAWKPVPALSFQASYAWMQTRTMQVVPGDVTLVDHWSTPKNTFAGTASWNFAPQWSLNGFVNHVGAFSTGASFGAAELPFVPAYTRVDLHIGRKLGHNFELDGGATNLQSSRHLEFGNGTDFVTPEYIPRSIFLNAAWSF